jgi:thromboxane-A synthase/cytochrome P450 family 3 subfamily A
VVSQLNTFLVAAFETTASAIACCIYFIAQHAGVQAALLQEVDAFGRTRKVAYNDLYKV